MIRGQCIWETVTKMAITKCTAGRFADTSVDLIYGSEHVALNMMLQLIFLVYARKTATSLP